MTPAEFVGFVFVPTVTLLLAISFLLYQRIEKLYEWLMKYLGDRGKGDPPAE